MFGSEAFIKKGLSEHVDIMKIKSDDKNIVQIYICPATYIYSFAERIIQLWHFNIIQYYHMRPLDYVR